MKETFSRTVTAFVSFQRFPSLSTLWRIFLRYLSSCSSAVGTRFRHSSTTRCLVALLLVLRASRCFLTFSVCADIFLCSFSSCWGNAKLSNRSNTVSLSKGGNASQSSWYELLPEKDGLRDSRGLPGFEEVESGVLLPSGGVDPFEELDWTRVISGDKLLTSKTGSCYGDGIGIGSDISDSVRRWFEADVTPKETRRNRFPPPKTSPSAMLRRTTEGMNKVGRRISQVSQEQENSRYLSYRELASVVWSGRWRKWPDNQQAIRTCSW